MKEALRILRSRKVAAWTIVTFVVYAVISTVFVQADYAAPYRNPVFLLLCAFLALSTGACAWERTRVAIHGLRRGQDPSELQSRMLARPTFVVPTKSRPEVAVRATADALRGLGMRVSAENGLVTAASGGWGRLGSAVFHWSLALLFGVIAVGQLTYSGGFMLVVEGGTRNDVAQSYTGLDNRPLAPKKSGFSIAVPKIEKTFRANGLEQGVTPFVQILSPEGEVAASGHAYPNHPVRAGSVSVHASDYGLALVVNVATPDGTASRDVFLEYTEDRLDVVPDGFEIAATDGTGPTSIVFDLPEDASAEASPVVAVRVGVGGMSPNGGSALEALLRPGESMSLPGAILTVERLTRYAKLVVTDDWSVLPIYVLFGTALLGLMVAMWSRPRRCWATYFEDDPGGVRVAVRSARADLSLADTVRAAVTEALEREEAK